MVDVKNHNSMYEKIILVSELYYLYNLSQQEISERLAISRPWVSKLLKRAEEMGIVRIEVMTPSAGISKHEQLLIERFNLKRAKVVKNISRENGLVNVGKAAAYYIISSIKQNDIIGVSWGRTLSIMAEQFVSLHYPNVKVIPIIGGIGKNPEFLSNQIVSKIASAMGAQFFLLHAPAFTVGRMERDTFLKDTSIKNVMKESENINIVVTGLGSLRNSTIQLEGYISNEEIEELEKLGAVGDIALRFINSEGNIVSHDIHNRLVGADFTKLCKNGREVIGVAVGKHKVPVIRAALKGKWIDVLITDDDTAEELLK